MRAETQNRRWAWVTRRRLFAVGTVATVFAGFGVGMVTAGTEKLPAAGATRALGGQPDLIGQGERLIMVVGGVFDTEAEAQAANAQISTGEMQGFYVDQTDGYGLLGVYEQVSPDKVLRACGPDKLGEELGCFAHDAGQFPAYEAVALRYHNLLAAKALLAAPALPACGEIGSVPCPKPLLKKLLPGLDLTPGKWMLVSAFRTKVGAQGFMELVRSGGMTEAVAVRALKMTDTMIGLGQESQPGGEGSLQSGLPNQEYYQQ